jgi:hypothetical protein
MLLDNIQSIQVGEMVANAQWGMIIGSEVQYEGYDEWLEVSPDCPGDVESNPCLVFCKRSHESGASTVRNYEYI